MLFLLLSVMAVSVVGYPQLDESLLVELFGPARTNTKVYNENINLKPRQNTIYIKQNDRDCQCVPYYLCDRTNTSVYMTDPKFNGWGVLDIRFGGKEENCQESVERCCKSPAAEPPPEPVTSGPKTLRGCGFRNPRGLDFTVKGDDGNEAQFGEFPWVVALLDAKSLTYVGVGVLIHPQVVMTGAHIAYKFAPGSLIARAGEWDTRTKKERLKSQERLVKEIVIRHDFNQHNAHNDLAILRLQEPVELMDHINVICLPQQNENFDQYKNCVANGWGSKNFDDKDRFAVILKKVEINMVDSQRCSSLLRQTRLGHWFKLHESFVCAGGDEGKDTCTGDGGAPLACPVGNDRYKLSGLVAWGIGCGFKNVPAVYARVSMFRTWIDQIVTSWGYDVNGYNL